MKRLEKKRRMNVAHGVFHYRGLNESGCSKGASRSRSSRWARLRVGDSSVGESIGSSKGEGPMVPASEAGVMMTGGGPIDERW